MAERASLRARRPHLTCEARAASGSSAALDFFAQEVAMTIPDALAAGDGLSEERAGKRLREQT